MSSLAHPFPGLPQELPLRLGPGRGSSRGHWDRRHCPRVLPRPVWPFWLSNNSKPSSRPGPCSPGRRLQPKSWSQEVTTMSLEDTMCVGPRRPLPPLACWVSVPPHPVLRNPSSQTPSSQLVRWGSVRSTAGTCPLSWQGRGRPGSAVLQAGTDVAFGRGESGRCLAAGISWGVACTKGKGGTARAGMWHLSDSSWPRAAFSCPAARDDPLPSVSPASPAVTADPISLPSPGCWPRPEAQGSHAPSPLSQRRSHGKIREACPRHGKGSTHAPGKRAAKKDLPCSPCGRGGP